jgi:lipoprotein-anchoring transpeptidase ErfK/SrfK
MKKRRKSKLPPVMIAVLILIIGISVFFFIRKRDEIMTLEIPKDPAIVTAPTPENPEPIKPPSEPLPEPVNKTQEYYMYTMKTSDAQKELSELIGPANITAVLQTNRIDLESIKANAKIVIPKTFDLSNRTPFPLEVAAAADIEKLLVINQRVQAFGAYEFGRLVRWGPTSTGKQSTKTADGLFSTNWKGKEVKSSFDDEWILKYNFNFDNFEGIGFHQYSMPGYPASHSCIRLLLEDAMWLYEWADQWILSPDERSRLAHGTPVLIFDDYAFGKTAPWKLLPEDATATTISIDDLSEIITANKDTIMVWQEERVALREVPEE